MGGNFALGFGMILVGMAFVSGGVMVMVRKSPRPSVASFASDALSESPARQSIYQTSAEKGEKFEKWVVSRFDKPFFNLKEWRGDKSINGVYAESSLRPDLEIEFELRGKRTTFAVECKWRRAFDGGDKPGLEWATEKQIARYRQFQRERNLPVFVVIGIGGEPHDPAELYIANLDRLRFPYATAEYLARFRRTNPRADFYFDDTKVELR